MTPTEFIEIVGITPIWFELGVVDDDLMQQHQREWQASDDRHSEHYRYRAFRDYLNKVRPLSEVQCAQMLELGEADPDLSLGGSIMADILKLTECPQSILQDALSREHGHLVKIAKRRLRID